MTTEVLHVNAETTWRGGENQVFQLSAGMRGHITCAVACVAGSPLAQRAEAASIAIRPLPGDRGLSAICALRRVLRELRPRILHAHTSRTHQLCLLASWGMDIPVIVTRRVDFPLKRGPLARWKYINHKVRFVAISRAIARVLMQGGVPEERITLIHSGVDFAALDAAPGHDVRAEFGIPAESVVVLNVAALSDHKDHATLLAAWKQVEDRPTAAVLLIAGEGELRAELEQLIVRYGLKRVRLLGYRTDVPSLMKGSDLFVMSSHLEGLCTSIMDAKRCALPVVATRAGGIPEVVGDGVDGTLVAIRDPSALAVALEAYVRDPVRRKREGAAGREDSRRFSAAAMVDGYLALYRKLLATEASA